MPVVFQPEHGIALAAENHTVSVAEFREKCFQPVFCGAAGSQHTGIRDQTPTDHDGLY